MPHSNDSIVLDNYMRVRVFNLKCFLKCVWWSVVGAVGVVVNGVQPAAAVASLRPTLIDKFSNTVLML